MRRKFVNLTLHTNQLQQEVSQFLQKARQDRLNQAANQAQTLTQNRQARRTEVAERLAQLAEARQAAAQELRTQLDENRGQRIATVAEYLTTVQAERQARTNRLNEMLATSQASRLTAVNELMGTFQATHQPAATPSVAPLTNAPVTPAFAPKAESSKPVDISAIKASELVAYLMETTGKHSLEDLEKHFGAKRLQINWEEFIGLLDDLRPGSRTELEAAKRSNRAEKSNGSVKRQKDGLTLPAAPMG